MKLGCGFVSGEVDSVGRTVTSGRVEKLLAELEGVLISMTGVGGFL